MNSEKIPSVLSAIASIPPAPLEPLTYFAEEAAQALGVSLATIYRRNFKPPPGLRHKRISKRQIHAYLNGGQGA